MKVTMREFLLDVLMVSLGAFGGPEAHYGIISEQMVRRKSYITEEELLELMALTGILPGPSSTQTIVAIGYKLGGPLLGLLTFFVWALPAIILMTSLSFMSAYLSRISDYTKYLRYLSPMAVGFVIAAAFSMGKKVIKDKMTLILFIIGAVATYFIRSFWIFPAVLVLGGVIAIIFSGEKNLFNRVNLNPPWKYLILYASILFSLELFASFTGKKIFRLAWNFCIYGSLVIGGGQVVIPMMYQELVGQLGYLSSSEFTTGLGIVQGTPGPMFSFAAYAGGLSARDNGVIYQATAALVSGLSIFLPGIILIYFVYPIWEKLKKIRAIKVSLKGITAVAAGIVAASAAVLLRNGGFSWDNLAVTGLSTVVLILRRIPSPFVVLASLLLGFIF